MLRPLRIAVAALVAVSSAACTDDTGFLGGTLTPTSIAVDPQYFLGDVVCSDAPGGMKSFVATLFDVSVTPDQRFELPSSPPTPCTESVQFRLVVPGRAYEADIVGYEQAPEDLVASALDCEPAPDSGSRHMCTLEKDPATGKDVLVPAEPRWIGQCGGETTTTDPAPPTIAIQNLVEPIRTCSPLTDTGVPKPPRIVVDPNATLIAPLACTPRDTSGPPGTIESFDVLPADASLTAYLDIPCGSIPPAYEQGVVAGATLEFRVEAHDVDADAPLRAARCWVVPAVDLERTATCEPLSDLGTLRLAPLEEGLACLTGAEFTATMVRAEEDGGGTFELGPFPCEEPVEVAAVKHGSYEITLVARDAMGTEVLEAACTAEVAAAATTTAVCAP